MPAHNKRDEILRLVVCFQKRVYFRDITEEKMQRYVVHVTTKTVYTHMIH